jgi:hypothetical protein
MTLKKGEDCWWEAVFNLLVVVLVSHDIYLPSRFSDREAYDLEMKVHFSFKAFCEWSEKDQVKQVGCAAKQYPWYISLTLHARHPAPQPLYWTPTFKTPSLLVILVVNQNSSTPFPLSDTPVTTARASNFVPTSLSARPTNLPNRHRGRSNRFEARI